MYPQKRKENEAQIARADRGLLAYPLANCNQRKNQADITICRQRLTVADLTGW